MWTAKNRPRYNRDKLRCPSDLTDEEWALVEPLIPPGKRGGGKRTVVMREVMNGIVYVLSTGCQWRAILKDLPPRSTLYGIDKLRSGHLLDFLEKVRCHLACVPFVQDILGSLPCRRPF